MRRALSFGRRGAAREQDEPASESARRRGSAADKTSRRASLKQNREHEHADEHETHEGKVASAAHAAADLGKRFVRSASFSRKGRTSKTKESVRQGDADSDSDEQEPANEHQENKSPTVGVRREARPIQGWLLKRHQHTKSVAAQWARRYFQVDDLRGTLSYAKGENKKATVVLPLADVTAVRLCKRACYLFFGMMDRGMLACDALRPHGRS